MTKEAMKLALEALENSVDLVREDADEAIKLYGRYPTRQGKVAGLKVLADDHEKAIIALRLEIDALNMASKPAVPDAIGPNEDELPAYAAGWNDCRQLMLEMARKP